MFFEYVLEVDCFCLRNYWSIYDIYRICKMIEKTPRIITILLLKNCTFMLSLFLSLLPSSRYRQNEKRAQSLINRNHHQTLLIIES